MSFNLSSKMTLPLVNANCGRIVADNFFFKDCFENVEHATLMNHGLGDIKLFICMKL